MSLFGLKVVFLSQQLRGALLVEDTEERWEPVFVATLKVTNEEDRNQKKDLILNVTERLHHICSSTTDHCTITVHHCHHRCTMTESEPEPGARNRRTSSI